jgi:hypothetical protein
MAHVIFQPVLDFHVCREIMVDHRYNSKYAQHAMALTRFAAHEQILVN